MSDQDKAVDAEVVEVVAPMAVNPMQMLSMAVSSGANVEVLERLVGLSERYQANEAARTFSIALSNMRNNLPILVKNKEVNFNKTQYKYEDLAGVVDQLSPVLAAHGLSFRWRTDTDTPNTVKVTCIISHKDGHSEETTLGGPVDTSGNKNAIQAVGSAVTYLQRYTLKAAVGVAASADDDGRGARDANGGGGSQGESTGNEGPPVGDPPPEQRDDPGSGEPPPEDEPAGISEAQQKLVIKLSKSHVWTEKESQDFAGCSGWSLDRAKKGLDWMQKELKERKAAEPKPAKKASLARLRAATRGKNPEGLWEMVGVDSTEPIDTMTDAQVLDILDQIK